MTNTTYATIGDLKARLTIKPGSVVSEPTLQDYLNAAAEEVDHWTRGYKPGVEAFSAVTATRAYDDDLSAVVNIDDCLAVTSVQRANTTIPDTSYKLWPYNRLPAQALYFRANLAFEPIIVGGTWYEYPYAGVGAGQILITGSWGYCAANARPTVVRAATLMIAAWAYSQEGVTPKEKMQALRDPTKPFYWEVEQRLAPLRRNTAVYVG